MHDFLVSVAAFIVLIGVMVVVHEFGHFIVAKLCGVRVEAFSVGFGPRLFGVKFGETDYKVCLLPLGGFVKMTGETPADEMAEKRKEGGPEDPSETTGQAVTRGAADDPGAFSSHPRWQRMLIGLAGPTANFILAFGLMIFYFGWINEVPSVQVKTTTVDWVTPDSPAAQAGFEPGDVIRRFDSVNNPTWDQIYDHSLLNANQMVPTTVERGNETVHLLLHIPADAKSDDFDLGETGLLPKYLPGPIVVAQVEPGMPAAKAGLEAGDGIESVDGHEFHSVPSLLAYLQSGKGKPVSLVLLREGKLLPPLIVRPAQIQGGWKLGFDWVAPPTRNEPLPLAKAASKAANFCADNSFLIVEVLERMFTQKVSVSQLTGPIGIAQMAGQAAQMQGWYPKFGLAGEISLNLGILNLLPFPILDGGLIMLLIIESTMRHDISLNVKERIYQAAFVVLVVFFAFIIFNDVTKLHIFSRGKP